MYPRSRIPRRNASTVDTEPPPSRYPTTGIFDGGCHGARPHPLTNAKPTSVPACKVAWRGDGEQLVVVQADEFCQEDVGSLARLAIKDVTKQTQVGFRGDNPVFQPLTLGP